MTLRAAMLGLFLAIVILFALAARADDRVPMLPLAQGEAAQCHHAGGCVMFTVQDAEELLRRVFAAGEKTCRRSI